MVVKEFVTLPVAYTPVDLFPEQRWDRYVAAGDLVKKIRKIHESTVTVLLVEQTAHMALGISDRAYILEVLRCPL